MAEKPVRSGLPVASEVIEQVWELLPEDDWVSAKDLDIDASTFMIRAAANQLVKTGRAEKQARGRHHFFRRVPLCPIKSKSFHSKSAVV